MDQLVDFTARASAAFDTLAENLVTWVATSGIQILLILIGAWIAIILSRRLLKRFHRTVAGRDSETDRVKRADTLTAILGTIISILLFLAAGMMVLREIGVDITPIIAVAGLGGLAIGFGAQSLVRDVITGFFLLAEDQLRVGDIVEVAGKAGTVEALSLRTVKLRALDGTLHIVPNGSISTVSNMTKGFSYALVNVGVAYRENTDEVFEVIRQVGADLQNDPQHGPSILEPMEVHGITNFGDSAVTIRCRMKTVPGNQWGIGREFNRRIKMLFDERDIEIPYPHLTLYAGTDKQGQAAPLNVAVQGEPAKALP